MWKQTDVVFYQFSLALVSKNCQVKKRKENNNQILSKLSVFICFWKLLRWLLRDLCRFFCSSLFFCCFHWLFKQLFELFILSDFSFSAAKVHQLSDPLYFPPTPSGGSSVLPSSVPSHCHGLGSAGSSGNSVARSGCCPLAHDAHRCLGKSRGPARGWWMPSRGHERGHHSPHFLPQCQQKPHPSSPPKYCPRFPAITERSDSWSFFSVTIRIQLLWFLLWIPP